MAITLTLPLGTTAVLPCDSTPTAYSVDTQHIVRIQHPQSGTLHIRPINLGTVTIHTPSWAHGQDVVVTVVPATGTATANGVTATYSLSAAAPAGTLTPTVAEHPSGRPAVPAGTAGGITPQVSGKPN